VSKTDVRDITDKRTRSIAVRNRIKNPLGSPSFRIFLKKPDMEIRIVDSGMKSGRISEMTQKGWGFVGPDDVVGKVEDYGFTVQDGRIVRGDRGREVLMMMHHQDYVDIQMAKAAANTRAIGGQKGKDAVLNQVAKAEGDEAADWIDQRIKVTDTREPEEVQE
jgi:hypothetical protein